MHTTRNILKVGSASVVLAAALIAGSAQAQTTGTTAAPADDSKTIVVTGSISRNKAAATASPIQSITADELARRGQNTISDALQTLPANNAGSIGSNWSALGGFATGAAAVSLRGFDDGYTLTLFDGMRTAFYPIADDGYRNIVDLNSIPDSIVSGVDVLEDGASATYGSDAIAGVVNVLIKKEVQGLHTNISGAISQRGDAGEKRVDVTYGIGKLSRDGYNFYVNAEYQKNDPLFFNQRGFPYNTADQSSICGKANGNGNINGTPVPAGAPICKFNAVANGVQFNGVYNAFQATQVGFAAPTDPNSLAPLGSFQALNPAAGCGNLTPYTLTAAQLAANSTTATNAGAPATVCQEDFRKQYTQDLPDIRRIGANARFTKDFGSSEAYVMFNFLQTKTLQTVQSINLGNGQTTGAGPTPGGAPVAFANVYLPVYVCPQGVGSITGGAIMATGCNAGNGVLNPNNPFAAQGQLAQLYEISNRETTAATDNKVYRISAGLSGTFGTGWDYRLDGTSSWNDLGLTYANYVNLQSLENAVAQGTFNFVNQNANSEAAWQGIAPLDKFQATSKLTQIQGHVGKDLFVLPGGSANVTVGAGYRFESVNDPSANGPNEANPANRYLSLNAVAVTNSSRRVYTGFYEISLPILDTLRVKADGSYDHYTTNYGPKYSRFSPKFEAEFRVIKQLKLRGTYSQGFAAPSFAEAGHVLPAIGYQSTTIDCVALAAFCAAHASNPSYYQNLSIGLGSSANPNLQPQKSKSYTLGAVFEPTPHITMTFDYWHTKITNYILPQAVNAAASNAYYTTGVLNSNGTQILQSAPDPKNPGALPTILAELGLYSNSQAEVGSGFDFSSTIRYPIGNGGLKWISQFNASYLAKLYQTEANGSIQTFAGLLSPCNISSCSGAPRLRGVWANTLDFNGRGTMTLTANYTSGYKQVATDFGGVPGHCQTNTGTGVPTPFEDNATPVSCKTNATFDLDWSGSVKAGDHFTLYANILNVLNNRPPYDNFGNYGLTNGYNAAWGQANFIGRYFRVGAKVDF